MSKGKKTVGRICDKKAAASLAASSLLSYFQNRKWKMISFFPNAVCVGKPCPFEKKKDVTEK